ncbi:hypothetical protein E4U52_003966, partial [Claviceps spartinae]
MTIDFSDPAAVRLYVANLEERDRKRRRLHEVLEEEAASLREEIKEAVQKRNAV